MCCLFGMVDYGHTLSTKRKGQILTVLATECEARGTDATGIAYNSHGRLRIYKKPVPAHQLRILVPPDASVITGHTRMTTQGNAKRNYNNHPFRGVAGQLPFALSHNGILRNRSTDRSIQHQQVSLSYHIDRVFQQLRQKQVLARSDRPIVDLPMGLCSLADADSEQRRSYAEFRSRVPDRTSGWRAVTHSGTEWRPSAGER